LGHLIHKIVQEMTYNVSIATLNSYYTILRSYRLHLGLSALLTVRSQPVA